MSRLDALSAITFDCWGTLIYEPPQPDMRAAREELFLELLRSHHVKLDAEEPARAAFRQAARRHWESWRGGIATGSGEIARWALEALRIESPALEASLVRHMEERVLETEVRALEGARETLERLAQRGIRRGLICDTGFSPGRVVRTLLDRAGLLELLEVTVFSDEAGVPKPDARVFHHALGELGVRPEQAAHVGDLRRTDVQGARAVGMTSVRIRCVNDDLEDLADADHVADSHRHLCELLGL